jgi:NAD(P)H dehydrogenase (quinone)
VVDDGAALPCRSHKTTGEPEFLQTSRREFTKAFTIAVLTAPITGAIPLNSNTAEAQASKSSDKIIVSGASGQLGKRVVTGLLAKGVPAGSLILVSRSTDALDSFAKQGAVVRYGDFEKRESLAAAFAGGTRLLLISVGFGGTPRPELHRRAMEAAKAVGVKQIAYTSWVALSKGDTTGLGVDHSATEELLKKNGVPYTFLRNSIYMDMLAPAAAKMVADGRATAVPNEIKLGYVTRADCAAAAIGVLTTPGHDNKAYDITGPELIGQSELAAAASAVTGKVIPVVQPEPGAPPPRQFGTPAASFVSEDVQKITGRAPTGLRAFLEANKAQLTGAKS